MSLKVYNSLSRKKEEFQSITPGHVGMYVCGPTVSGESHLGHARPYITFDVVYRYLVHLGYKVRYVRNITDAGHFEEEGREAVDKISIKAVVEKLEPMELVQKYTNMFHWAMKQFNNVEPSIEPTATGHILEQIELIETLLTNGFAYVVDGSVYFDVKKYNETHGYGILSGRNIEELMAGYRDLDGQDEKRNSIDFALWKKAPEEHIMRWNSPWGPGFPGWHIECSAMAMKYLGEHFDVHTGGIEHIPVHHTNEIAQSECATGTPYVNYWMHNNHLLDTTGKMSKSNGEFLTVSTLRDKGYNPLAYRYFLLTAHYRKELSFSFEALDAASVAYKKLVEFMVAHKDSNGSAIKEYENLVLTALSDDLATPEAIATIWKLMKDGNINDDDKHATLLTINEYLGLGLEKVEGNVVEIPEAVQELLYKRKEARASRNFTLSDTLRDEIASHGFMVKDTENGQEISKLEKQIQ